MSDDRIKALTGGDTLTGRVPYGKEDISFTPSHKLVIVGNHKPDITDNSEGMWRRVALTEFGVTIPVQERDRCLLEKLKAEAAGILNWMVEGLQFQQRQGLAVPTQVLGATEAYRCEQDMVGEWIVENCRTGRELKGVKSSLYSNYRCWAQSAGQGQLSQKRLTRQLGERGFPLDASRRHVTGLDLKLGASSAWDELA